MASCIISALFRSFFIVSSVMDLLSTFVATALAEVKVFRNVGCLYQQYTHTYGWHLLPCLLALFSLPLPCPLLPPHLPTTSHLSRSMASQQIWAMLWLRTTLGFTQFTASYMRPGSLCGASRWPALRNTPIWGQLDTVVASSTMGFRSVHSP